MPIRMEISGQVAVITIDRPEKMNALDVPHNEALAQTFAEFEDADSLRCAVLTGAGTTAFCAGADLVELIPPFRDAIRTGQSLPWTFAGITDGSPRTKPIVAAINGHALAGGLEVALACDMRLASPNATFGLAETKWAIIPGAGGTQRLPRAVPLGPAMEMILTGEPITADDAVRWGLVNRIVPADDLLHAAIALAASIAQRGPLAVAAARRAVLEGLDAGLAGGLAFEQESFFEVLRTEDADEGLTAFAEKRAPRYEGK